MEQFMFYSREIILSNIEKNKDNINYVECYIDEDYEDTRCAIFEDNDFTININAEQNIVSDTLKIMGLHGSYKAEPMMKIVYKDGSHDEIPCFKVKEQIDVTNELRIFIDSLKDKGILKLELKANRAVIGELDDLLSMISRMR